MMRTRPLLLLCVSLLALLPAAGASAAPPREFFGVSTPEVARVGDLKRMDRGRVGTIRFTINWAGVQGREGAPYNWDRTDAIVAGASSRGLKLLPVLYGTPAWATGCRAGADQCVQRSPLSTAKSTAGWRQFVRAAAERYGPNGAFWRQPDLLETIRDLLGLGERPNVATANPIRRWQLWNEPNSARRWLPKPDPEEYARLVTISHREITAADRGGKVLLGGMFGTPFGGQKPSLRAWQFLERLYRVSGVERSFDGTAVHPYAQDLRGIRYQVSRARREMKAAGDGDAGLWVTELGWGSENVGLKGQARMLRESFRMLLRGRQRWNIGGLVWFSWRDRKSERGWCDRSFCRSTGLLEEDGTPKPAWPAYTGFTGGKP